MSPKSPKATRPSAAQASLFAHAPALGEPEAEARSRGLRFVAGIDEAGRGPLAGPVVAACVVLPPDAVLRGLNDSKQLTAQTRERLDAEIRACAVAYAVVAVGPERIDAINILAATKEAMCQALAQVKAKVGVELVLIDGNQRINTELPQRPLVGGDALSLNIAAASVLAKVSRDATMATLHTKHPQYGFDKHKGYPTADHYAALRAHGPSPVHRRTFRGVVQP